ncbi:MAG: PCRF domain-containing protein, partial [Butyrivibrio sp.]|nr:PCRF domain-containing protein [Butyrivibrio sp.]
MVILDQMKVELQNLRGTLDEVTASLDLDNKKKIIEELNREMEEPTFWDNAEKANRKTKDLKNMQDLVENMEKLHGQYDDIIGLIDMQNAEGVDDEDMAAEIRGELDEFEATLE